MAGHNHSALENRNNNFNHTYGPDGYTPNKHHTLNEEDLMGGSPE